MRTALAIALGAACGARAGGAHADPPATTQPGAAAASATAGAAGAGGLVSLAWVRGEGADGCIAQGALAREVALRLGRDPFALDAPRAIEAVVARESAGGSASGGGNGTSGAAGATGRRLVARIYVRDAVGGALIGARELTSDAPTCDSLGGAVALAIAVAIDPAAALRPRPAPRVARVESAVVRANTQGAAAAVATRPRTAAPPPAAPRAARDERAAATLTARFVGAFGLLPALPSFGLALATDVHLIGPLRLTAGMILLPEVARLIDPATLPPMTSARPDVAFGLAAAWLGACVEPARGARWALAGCASVMAGAIHAVVYAPAALEPVEPGNQAWAAGTLGVRLTVVPVGPLALEIGADGIVPFVRHDFRVTGRPDDNFQQTVVGAVVYAGLGLRTW